MIPIEKKLTISYQYCRDVSKMHAKTFYFASRFLPPEKRNACYSIYAFCRYIDDLVDKNIFRSLNSEESLQKLAEAVEEWRRQLKALYKGEYIDHPIMIALKDTISKFGIPENLPNELIDGVNMDITKTRYENFEDLKIYCYKVASVVGLMTTHVFGFRNDEAFGYAVDLGIAMQMTNILRDIKEDSLQGRIYLPAEDMKMFGYSEDELMNQTLNSSFRKLMEYQVKRAADYYDVADKGIGMLERDSRVAVGLMSRNYRKILNVIKENDFNIFSKRVYVPVYRKLADVPSVVMEFR
ncbi:MAG: phytoene/squalene synthase family protein [Ignavibacteria bacterium]|nr:phytoene/squalene synthase family protein [Ignavibacteria bacterium]